MRQNFFEVIGMADVERVHSQMIAWLFDGNVLADAQKSEILTALTGHKDEYAVVQVSTEHDHIDVLIETESALIAIENKIKIAEHDEQLSRYEQSLEHNSLPRRLIYLSLLPENIACANWIARSYVELHSILFRHLFQHPSSFDEYAFNEYVEAVGHLTAVVAAFDEDHRQFINVFTDGSLTKRDKRVLVSAYTNPQNYVRANQLETVLQRHFMAKVRDRILTERVLSRIEETRGVALVNIVVARRLIGEMFFEWAVQFQGNTVKLNCYASDYATSKRDQLPTAVMADFQRLATGSFNGPNPGRTKAYVSVSKKMSFGWSDTFEEIADAHGVAYAELCEIGRSMAVGHGVEAI